MACTQPNLAVCDQVSGAALTCKESYGLSGGSCLPQAVCDSGFYLKLNQVPCFPCPNGYSCDGKVAFPCKAGYSCTSKRQTLCPPGGWNDALSLRDECYPCDRDSYCNNGVKTTCTSSFGLIDNKGLGKSVSCQCQYALCAGTDAAPFYKNPVVTLVAPSTGYLIDVVGALKENKNNDMYVWLWNPNAAYDGARWILNDFSDGSYQLKWSGTNKCLDADKGNKVHMWDCDSTLNNQRFTLSTTGSASTIKWAGSSTCLATTSTERASIFQFQPCDETKEEQKFLVNIQGKATVGLLFRYIVYTPFFLLKK